jgi:hypothetical protein
LDEYKANGGAAVLVGRKLGAPVPGLPVTIFA